MTDLLNESEERVRTNEIENEEKLMNIKLKNQKRDYMLEMLLMQQIKFNNELNQMNQK